MQLWKYFFDFFFGNESLPEAIATLLVKILAKPEEHPDPDPVQHLEKCLELEQPIIIHDLRRLNDSN